MKAANAKGFRAVVPPALQATPAAAAASAPCVIQLGPWTPAASITTIWTTAAAASATATLVSDSLLAVSGPACVGVRVMVNPFV